MKRTVGMKRFLLVAVICLGVILSIPGIASHASTSYAYTDQELDSLLAPIALYPDPLLAQMLPASTYPLEIADADAWLNRGGDVSRIDGQSWDESVRTIAHYPDILNMMAAYLDWTADLGEAFLDQPENVTRSIQRLRWQARSIGNLENTAQQTVIIDGDYIEIIPAQPQYVYIPQYDPAVVYTERWISGGLPLINFGLGWLIGSWLTMDFDWDDRRVIYHGWNRPGWVNHARPHVRVKDIYINRSRPYINRTWRHDASHGSPATYRASGPGIIPGAGAQARMPEVRGRSPLPSRPSEGIFGPRGNAASLGNRGRESRGITPVRPASPASTVARPPAAPVPGVGKSPSPVVSAGRKPPLAKVRPPVAPVPIIGKVPSQSGSAGQVVQPPKAPSATVVGREVRSPVPPRPVAPAQSIARPPAAPAPGVGKVPSPVVSVSRKPPLSQAPPATPAPVIGKSSSQVGRESLQPGKTPTVAFGGYRGAQEAKAQSMRGQSSRQSASQARYSAGPVNKGGGPAKMNADGGKKR